MTTGTRIALLLAAFFLGPALSAPNASAIGLMGNVSAGLGEKWGSDPYYRPIHEGGTLEPNANVMVGHRALPILLEGYASRTRRDGRPDTDNNVLFEETRIEVGLGAAGIWRVGRIYSHIGGGIARVSDRVKQLYSLEPRESSFTRTGHWIGAGTFFPLVAGFGVGAIGRYTNVNYRVPGGGNQIGGWSASAVLGWGWGWPRPM
jgi:hypothetical protein